MFRWLSTLLLVGMLSLAAHAETVTETIKAKLVESFPTHVPDSIEKSPVNGLYEVVYGTQVIYVTEDGKHIFQGVLMDLEDGKKDLTALAQNKARKKYLTEVLDQEPIIFGPKKAKYTITVFTDIDCGYCRKMHAEMKKYNDLGIRVRYLSFPRGGIGSKSYDDAVNVWCAADRQKAMTKAKQGQEIPTKKCDNPVKAEFELGQQLGVQGTPSIFLESGQNLPGYLPSEKLVQVLDENSSQS